MIYHVILHTDEIYSNKPLDTLKVSQSVGLYLAICTNNFDKSAVLSPRFYENCVKYIVRLCEIRTIYSAIFDIIWKTISDFTCKKDDFCFQKPHKYTCRNLQMA